MKDYKHSDWIEKCRLCWKACEHCIAERIISGKNLNCCNMCRDSTEISALCLQLELAQSSFFYKLCLLYADISEACALKCDKFSEVNDVYKNCAESCRQNAESCGTINT